jgi:hypothetical protein
LYAATNPSLVSEVINITRIWLNDACSKSSKNDPRCTTTGDFLHDRIQESLSFFWTNLTGKNELVFISKCINEPAIKEIIQAASQMVPT